MKTDLFQSCGSAVENMSADAGDAGDTGLILGLRRYLEGGNGNPFCYFCQENQMDRGVWQAIVHGVTKSQTCTHRKEQLDISNCPGQTQKMDSFSVPDYGRILNRTCFYDLDKTESHITQPLDLTESNYYCTLVFKISWSDLCLLQKAFLS